MTRDTGTSDEGGAKKFLYTGPAKRTLVDDFDDDVDNRQWNFDAQINATTNKLQHNAKQETSPEFDVEAVWSVKKNISGPSIDMTKSAPLAQGLDINTGKGYYSRHAGAAAGDASSSMPIGNVQTSGSSSVSWGQNSRQGATPYGAMTSTAAHNYNFSYGKSMTGLDGETVQRSQPPGPLDGPSNASGYVQPSNTFRTGTVTQGGRDTGSRAVYKPRPT